MKNKCSKSTSISVGQFHDTSFLSYFSKFLKHPTRTLSQPLLSRHFLRHNKRKTLPLKCCDKAGVLILSQPLVKSPFSNTINWITVTDYHYSVFLFWL